MKLIKRHFFLILLFIIMIIPLGDLLHAGLPLTHDGQDHVARIANFYQNLQEGTIIPRWAGNLNWGYGHPILIFLYPLPSYIASFFHFFGFSFVDSTKLVFATTFVASGLTMFLWMRKITDEKSAFIGSVLYVIAPYRIVDLYVRGAIGEHVAFVFLPLVLCFIAKLSKKISYWNIACGSISLALLLLSHNAISIMFLPLIFLYIFYLSYFSKAKKSFFFSSLLSVILAFGLAAFFWIPAFFEGKYTLRDIVTAGEYISRFVPFERFFSADWSYGGSDQLSKQIGVVHWILVVASVFATFIFYRKKNSLWVISSGLLGIFAVTLFLMTQSSNGIWQTLTTLQKFQFPWRFLSITVFAAAVLGGLAMSTISEKFKLVACCFLLFATLWFNKDYWRAQEYFLKPESFYTGIYNGTTDTGESSPIWSVRFMEKWPKAHIEVIDGNARIQELSRRVTEHTYIVDASARSRIRENTLYFPGWNVFIDGVRANIEFQDPANRGLMTFFTEKGIYKVHIAFSETKLRLFANIVSVVSLVFLVALGILRRGIWQHFR